MCILVQDVLYKGDKIHGIIWKKGKRRLNDRQEYLMFAFYTYSCVLPTLSQYLLCVSPNLGTFALKEFNC